MPRRKKKKVEERSTNIEWHHANIFENNQDYKKHLESFLMYEKKYKMILVRKFVHTGSDGITYIFRGTQGKILIHSKRTVRNQQGLGNGIYSKLTFLDKSKVTRQNGD